MWASLAEQDIGIGLFYRCSQVCVIDHYYLVEKMSLHAHYIFQAREEPCRDAWVAAEWPTFCWRFTPFFAVSIKWYGKSGETYID